MSARPPATREGFEFRAAVLFFWAPRMQFGWIAPPGRERRQRQTRRKPGTQSPEATARDAACHASRAAEPHSRREGFMHSPPTTLAIATAQALRMAFLFKLSQRLART